MSIAGLLLAAGAGRRFGRRQPKQLIRFQGAPLFVRPLRAFLRVPSVRDVSLVVPAGAEAAYARALRAVRTRATIRIVAGGAFRGASVRNGLRPMSKTARIVLVHDAARPVVSPAVIRRVERAAARYGAALAAWPLPDTLKQSGKRETVRKTVPRAHLWLAQTPQGFTRAVAEACLLRPSKTATDDVELAERKGYPVKLVLGDPRNIKVTRPADLDLCRAFEGEKA